MASSSSDTSSNKKDEFKEKFLGKYRKELKLPVVKTIFAEFHPLVPNHIITVNEVDFPQVGKGEKIKGMVHELVSKGLIGAVENKYFNDEREIEIKRSNKVDGIITYKKDEAVESSGPEEPSSRLFEDDIDEEELEGGDEDQKDNSDNPDPNRASRLSSFKKKNNPNAKLKPGKRHGGKSSLSKRTNQEKKIKKAKNNISYDVPRNKDEEYKSIATDGVDQINGEVAYDKDKHNFYNKAVDMYIKDKNLAFSYKGFHEKLMDEEEEKRLRRYDKQHDMNQHLSDKKFSPIIMDKHPFNKAISDDAIHLAYEDVPKLKGFNYVPAPFLEKFEICIWKVDGLNSAKIKHKYFTPDICLKADKKPVEFKVSMALDGQSILMVEESEEKSRVIVIIGTITLDKTSEFPVEVANPGYAKSEHYEEDADKYFPNEAVHCKTDPNFPRFVCWGQGKYVMVGVGAKPSSRVFYELKFYDAESKIPFNSVWRKNKPGLSGMIQSVNNHNTDKDKIVFITKEQSTTYSIVELDVTTSQVSEKTSINAHGVVFLKIAEDLSTVYVGKYEEQKDHPGSNKLYALDYGSHYNLTLSEKKPFKDLGQNVSYTQIIGNSIFVMYALADQPEIIKICSKRWTFKPKFKFHLYGKVQYEFDAKAKVFYAVTTHDDGTAQAFALGKGRSESEALLELPEITEYRFNFPNLMMLKGQREVITYDFNKKSYKYIELPAPFVLLMKHSPTELAYIGLIDIGEEYLQATFMQSSDAKAAFTFLKVRRERIDKDRLKPNEKLINYFGHMQMNFAGATSQLNGNTKGTKEESCVLLQTTNYLVGLKNSGKSR